ncbi:hypothetical protein [Aquimarina muelleri]|uniref:TonB C-terminal domain-containing protein n=1 Tax=Aquimarina muelleri TaxID=279356 RepID=A0A918N1C5_9FLAO|nr:hypothetical protein [Aquimarina muelleri]MCX2763465.1 hypothetical protein [Aquimarina muelleri]GGX02510.1 hypothetical protein GCM10007384_00280 [Aquimarina muelleri]
MKLLFATVVFFVFFGSAATFKTEPVSFDEKKKTEKKKEEVNTVQKRNVHSIKKWKMTIEYANGNIISKTIVVSKNSNLSALETAFKEADKYLENRKNVKEYSISPLSDTYVLLAGD